jgi:hypothetical protein
MYLASQRVRSRDRSGINVFLYRHRDGDIPWEDPKRIVENMPGELASSEVEVPPGGNEVLSFLDIVAMDGTDPLALQNLVERLRDVAVRTGVAAADGVGVRFAMTGNGQADREWVELAGRALQLLAHPPPLKWRSEDGLVIVREADTSGLVFTLTSASVAKLRELLGSRWTPPRVHVSHETMSDWSNAGFDVYEQLVMVATGYRLAELLPLGRVRVEDSRGELVWEWPATHPGLGYCMTCHRQHTLVANTGFYRCLNCGTAQSSDGRFVAALT